MCAKVGDSRLRVVEGAFDEGTIEEAREPRGKAWENAFVRWSHAIVESVRNGAALPSPARRP